MTLADQHCKGWVLERSPARHVELRQSVIVVGPKQSSASRNDVPPHQTFTGWHVLHLQLAPQEHLSPQLHLPLTQLPQPSLLLALQVVHLQSGPHLQLSPQLHCPEHAAQVIFVVGSCSYDWKQTAVSGRKQLGILENKQLRLAYLERRVGSDLKQVVRLEERRLREVASIVSRVYKPKVHLCMMI